MRSILLHIYNDDCQESRLQAALALARQCDGHITCVQAVSFEFGVPGDFYGTMAAQMAVEYDKVAREDRERIEGRLAKEDVRWTWHKSSGPATSLIARHAPLNDIVVMGAHNPYGTPETPSHLVTALTELVRAPLLVVPAEWDAFNLDVPAMIAWNGSPEAAHALRFTMPLLSRAAEVHILTVTEEKDADRFDLPPTGAAEYLARHGIEAEIVEFSVQSGKSTAETIMEAATSRKGGYLVMGAYGHSRLRERILGGVTRDMLRDPKIPLLLAN